MSVIGGKEAACSCSYHGFNSSSLGRRARSLLWLHRLDCQRGVFLCLWRQNLQSDICCSDISNWCKSTKRSGIRNEKLSCVIPIDRSETCRRNLLPPYTVDSNKPPSDNTKLQASLKPQVSAMSTQIVEDQTT